MSTFDADLGLVNKMGVISFIILPRDGGEGVQGALLFELAIPSPAVDQVASFNHVISLFQLILIISNT